MKVSFGEAGGPELQHASGPRAERGARTQREQILCALFAEVLGVDRVGVDENFFDLGGRSMSAVRLVAKIRLVLGVEITIRTLFDAPTVEAIVSRLEAAHTRPVPMPSGATAISPLSFSQHQLWVVGQIDGASPAYNIPLAFRLIGRLDLRALTDAFHDVVVRHESLRTTFPNDLGDPHRRVVDPDLVTVPTDYVDVTESELGEALDSEAVRVFDVAVDLPVRVKIFGISADHHVVAITLHHIAVDALSIEPLFRDLSAAYDARRRNGVPVWEPLPLHYRDYVAWQRELLGEPADPGSEHHRQLESWKQALAGLPGELSLPFSRPRTGVPASAGATVGFRLAPDLHDRLLAMARTSQATLFMVLQGAVATMLSRWGAGTDIPIGIPVAGRSSPALNDMVGLFVNTLVLRTDLSGNPTFRQLVKRIRSADLDAFDGQDLPFASLVDALNPVRVPGRSPLFQVMMALEDADRPLPVLEGVDVAEHRIASATVKTDLDITFTETLAPGSSGGGIECCVLYDCDLFDRLTVERMAQGLNRILHAVADDPDIGLGAIDVLGVDERSRLLEISGRGGESDVEVSTLPELFEARTALMPDAVALVFDGSTLTYSELNERANRLARHLIDECAVGPEQIVAMLLPRSTETVITLLAIAKTGAACLPMDTGLAVGRVHTVLREAEPACVVCSEHSRSLLQGMDVHSIVVDDAEVVSACGILAPDNVRDDERRLRLRPEHPAFCISTSGSTGDPKIVVIPHAGLANIMRLYAMRADAFLTRTGQRDKRLSIAHTTSTSFDASIALTLMMVAGHELHLFDDRIRFDTQAALRYLSTHDIQYIDTTPGYIQALIDEGLLEAIGEDGRLLVTLGGESLPKPLWDVLASHSRIVAYNAYGPTECTVDVTGCLVEPRTRPSIGPPIPSVRAYVLDADLNVVPDGVQAELYVAGIGVTRGYLDRAAATASRYVADPFGPPGTRMYRTGDVVKRSSDGALEFLGRVDDQVKIRGYRVELGEITTLLTSRADVGQAVAVVREPRPGDKQLLAYVVPAHGAELDPADLRRQLAAKLPDYMVPAAVMVLDVIPLSPTGKIDKAALPEPVFGLAVDGGLPRTDRQETLCLLFSEVLGVDQVGTDESFFDLGGNSLLAARLVGRIMKIFDRQIPLGEFFARPTVLGADKALADRGDFR